MSEHAQCAGTGTVLFFSFTYLAQLLLVFQLRQLRPLLPSVSPVLPALMLGLCLLLLGLGVMTIVLDAWDGDWYDTVENAFEWVLSLRKEMACSPFPLRQIHFNHSFK